MWDDDYERKGEGETQCRLIACSSRKAPRGPPGLRPHPTDESLSTVLYAFSTYILRRGLEFNPGCDVQSSDYGVESVHLHPS